MLDGSAGGRYEVCGTRRRLLREEGDVDEGGWAADSEGGGNGVFERDDELDDAVDARIAEGSDPDEAEASELRDERWLEEVAVGGDAARLTFPSVVVA